MFVSDHFENVANSKGSVYNFFLFAFDFFSSALIDHNCGSLFVFNDNSMTPETDFGGYRGSASSNHFVWIKYFWSLAFVDRCK